MWLLVVAASAIFLVIGVMIGRMGHDDTVVIERRAPAVLPPRSNPSRRWDE